MELPFKVLIEAAGFRSNDALAKEIKRKWKDGRSRNHRSLAIRIGELERGSSLWWKKNWGAAETLAILLRIKVEDLFASNSLIDFPDFPALRPFDPLHEKPCAIGTCVSVTDGFQFDWLHTPKKGDQEIGAYLAEAKPVWITAAPGVGKTFVAQYHRIRQSARVVEVDHLSEAIRILNDFVPTILDVRSPEGEEDRRMLELLRHRGRLMILAPFSIEHLRVEQEKNEPDKVLVGWKEYEWRAEPEWQSSFVDWILNRIEGRTRLTKDAFLSWIRKPENDVARFWSPADVLSLCGLMHGKGSDIADASTPKFVEEWLGQFLLRHADDPSETPHWLKHSGAAVVRAIARGRMKNVTFSWSSGLTFEEWEQLLTSEAQGQVAIGKRRVDEASSLMVRNSIGSPREAVHRLLATRLLRSQGKDLLEFHPRWLAEPWARESVSEAFTDELPATWGRWAVDEGRREIVDRQLDRLGEEDVQRLIDRVVQMYDPADLGYLGAVESLFSAAARRLQSGWRPVPDRVIPLATLQMGQWVESEERPDDLPIPLTRRSQTHLGSRASWVADCWVWSLRVEAPNAGIEDRYRWLFPGWSCPLIEMSPPWLSHLMYAALFREERGLRALDRLVDFTPEILDRCPNNYTQGLVHNPLIAMSIVLDLRPPRFHLLPEDAQFMVGDARVARYLLRKIERLGPDARRSLAYRLWGALTRSGAGATSAVGALVSQPSLRNFILGQLSPDAFEAALDLKNAEDLLAFLPVLPNELRGVTLKWFLKHRRNFFPQALWQPALKDYEGPGIVDVLEELATDPGYADSARKRLWRLDPKRALTLLERTQGRAEGEVLNWFRGSPSNQLPNLISFLEQRWEGPMTPRIRDWLHERFPDAGGGPLADRIHRLLNR